MSSAAVVVAAALACQCAILGAGIYEAVSVAPNWRRPASLAAYRDTYRHRHPGHFFQAAVPVTVLLLIVSLILTSIRGGDRVSLVVALAVVVSAEILTVLFFFPLNRALFFTPAEDPPGEQSRATVRRWERANIVRLVLQVPGVAASLAAFAALT